MEEKLKQLKDVKKLYNQQGNIIQHLRQNDGADANSTSDILISYDFQAGCYIQSYNMNPKPRNEFADKLAEVISGLGCLDSMLEAGVGEAVMLGNLLIRMESRPQAVYAFDLSWSRIKYGQQFLKSRDVHHVKLFTADMFQMPIKDNSVDLVYTVHAVEPNGGREREALIELYRIAKKYVVLLEPAFEFADEKARQRMLSHGYITNLYNTAIELGYNVIEHRLFERSLNPLNPTGLMIIEKNPEIVEQNDANPLCCPITKTSLNLQGTAYYSSEGMLAYPVLEQVPCLLPQNAIVATHFNDFQ
ncbi:methyltransferase domain-containing protein [Paenibacillus sp. DXFW5]|uniref:Methyltransferase domain-containing protein n=1 Tax=Paenibacillus rhizolycopersici TaxID=2780073 RepID=A0ABS2H8Y1_9BACL|nr:methyltransferase domain-containing protein [Paenibacillus rhizolycopersici]MBM6997246.1 methyltransferase domain-containing protein [Paenibacillus rhizolycopersici]